MLALSTERIECDGLKKSWTQADAEAGQAHADDHQDGDRPAPEEERFGGRRLAGSTADKTLSDDRVNNLLSGLVAAEVVRD